MVIVMDGTLAVVGADEHAEPSGGKLEFENNSSRPTGSLQEVAPFEAEPASRRAPKRSPRSPRPVARAGARAGVLPRYSVLDERVVLLPPGTPCVRTFSVRATEPCVVATLSAFDVAGLRNRRGRVHGATDRGFRGLT